MNIHRSICSSQRGFVLLLVFMLTTFSLVILTAMMNRTSTVAKLNNSSIQLNRLNAAAEAAVAKVYSSMAFDFQSLGPTQVSNNLTSYSTLLPSSSDNPYWTNIVFYNPLTMAANAISVTWLSNYTGIMPGQYSNQFAFKSGICRIACNTKMTNSLAPGVVGTIQEDVMLSMVPLSTYAVFYNGELEFSGCPSLTINGRVHSNGALRTGAASGSTLTFNAPVTSHGVISAPARGGLSIWTETDPSTWRTTFNSTYKSNCATINLALMMTNPHSMLELPPVGESPMSQLGQARLYNRAHIVIIVTNTPGSVNPTIYLTLQTAYNSAVPGNDSSKVNKILTNVDKNYLNTNFIVQMPFLRLTNIFYDLRQQQTNVICQIDMSALGSWLGTNALAVGKFTSQYYPTLLYVADRRASSYYLQSVVRLVNASKLPYNGGLGFSVATPNPLYVAGNYNVTVDGAHYAYAMGSTTNGSSVPAAVYCDAFTLLSTNWLDANSAGSFAARNAGSTTFNAAIVAGIAPTTGTTSTNYSGGVHNLCRLLEDWTGDTLTLNTSMIMLYYSQIATDQYLPPSSANAYFRAPTLNWSYDPTFSSPSTQPPGMPCALIPIRYNWQRTAPGI